MTSVVSSSLIAITIRKYIRNISEYEFESREEEMKAAIKILNIFLAIGIILLIAGIVLVVFGVSILN